MVKNASISGLIGVILGVVLVWWVRPDTSGGTALLLVASIITVVVVAQIIRGMLGLFSQKNRSGQP
ncbi:hypothetical protein ELI20_37265 [Rhizobium ruizarguesonis]|uniref:hypothetical protein n=1 Tax=Rhizobium ruizarguesonis TaxID=2081791 RepID=UPI001031BF53|nr:hypothetical protein [Rhizobium ruizarguesonis]TAW03857.1 hypothetical protein ELI20_37265 [Rhizobium ruizarguesonis]